MDTPADRVVPLPPPKTLRRDEAPVASAGQLAVKEAPQAAAPEPRALSSFKDILALAGEKRDIKLKGDLERLVRPIRVSPGQFELALEPSAPPGLPGEIARKLEAWTGARWMVLVARGGGEKPLAAQARDSRDTAFRKAREHPDIQAALKRFPGAEILNVKEPETQNERGNDEESR